MKKIICLFLTIVILCSLTACGAHKSSTTTYEMQIMYRIEADWNQEFQDGKVLADVSMDFELANKFREAVKALPEDDQNIIPDINKLFNYNPLLVVELESGEIVYIIHFIAVKFTETDGEIVISDLARVTKLVNENITQK